MSTPRSPSRRRISERGMQCTSGGGGRADLWRTRRAPPARRRAGVGCASCGIWRWSRSSSASTSGSSRSMPRVRASSRCLGVGLRKSMYGVPRLARAASALRYIPSRRRRSVALVSGASSGTAHDAEHSTARTPFACAPRRSLPRPPMAPPPLRAPHATPERSATGAARAATRPNILAKVLLSACRLSALSRFSRARSSRTAWSSGE
mmetsp:Transcript_18052/g.59071  ORF Transcript_18052/g.59071 Transcript_18052/m.59071 type:complete len:207 (-) Transcript_18052:681-1301(-)